MKNTANYYIKKLDLATHVEGGAFKEIYRSEMMLAKNVLSDNHKADRNVSTAIYFLLIEGQFSAFHKIASDEMWHFYDGDPLCIYEITTSGVLIKHVLGRNMEMGESFTCVIKAGSWFGSRCEVKDGFSLVGCTVAPGFDFEDFELAKQQELKTQYPQHITIIEQLTTL
jgi:uncharacterized protein